MAHRWYGVNKGQTTKDVATGATVLGKNVEVDIDLTKSLLREEVIRALDTVRDAMLEGNWPPAVTSVEYRGWGLNRGQTKKDIAVANPVAATGTITLASALEGDTVTFNGVIFTGQDLREKFTVLCVADSSGSLNSKYFLFNTPTVAYYVWLNVNSAGVDPAVADRTGVEVAVATDAANTVVAEAVKVAIDALAGAVATRSSATVTVVMAVNGACTDAAQGGASTGFTITVTRQGAASPSVLNFDIGSGDTAAAVSLASRISTNADTSLVASAVSALGVVTVTALEEGTPGNALTMASSDAGRLALSAATLENGAETAAKDIRVQVRMAALMTRNDVFLALTQIQEYILQSSF